MSWIEERAFECLMSSPKRPGLVEAISLSIPICLGPDLRKANRMRGKFLSMHCGPEGRVSEWIVRGAVAVVCVASATALVGCSNAPKPLVQAITVTDAMGNPQPAITSIQHGGPAIYLDATVVNDEQHLGIDWTVTCSSSLPPGTLPAGIVDTSCGTFAPNHTTSGPIPPYVLPAGIFIVTSFTPPANTPNTATVTITAHATSDPSETSTLVLQVN
jgi:hypothetical protein